MVLSKWISVKERLPKDGYVLTCAVYENGNSAIGIGYYDGGWVIEFCTDVGGYSPKATTHWMPMPEPPKEGE